MRAQGVEKTTTTRKHFFERFGSGQTCVLQNRVRKYLLAMPDNNGVAFPNRVNTPDKLDQLEEERERNYLLRMCPKDKHKDYEEGKESTVVRTILSFLPVEYDDAVQHVRNMMRSREMVKSGNIDAITNLDDAVKIIYDTSWLPPYAELRVSLVNAWMKMKRRWDEASGSRNKAGHPIMVTSEDGNAERTCYGCGRKGHVRGDDIFRAGKDAVWSGAPKAYLDKTAKKFGKTPTQNTGKRPLGDEAKPPCKFHAASYCKWADRCNFLRDYKGNEKGKGKGKGKGKFKGKGQGGGTRSQKTSLIVKKKGVQLSDDGGTTSMVIGKSYDVEGDEVGNDCEEELYNLMRGHTTLMVAGEEFEEEEDESDSESESGDQAVEPVVTAPEWGSSSIFPGWGNTSNAPPSAPEWGSTLSRAHELFWGSS